MTLLIFFFISLMLKTGLANVVKYLRKHNIQVLIEYKLLGIINLWTQTFVEIGLEPIFLKLRVYVSTWMEKP